MRLMKLREPPNQGGDAQRHPLNQKASEGFVWKWLPYTPGGPPLRSPGEFSVPVDQGEVDAILNAVEAGRSIPVFTANVDQEKAAALFATFKEKANAFFKAGDYLKAIATYDRALDLKPSPSDKDAAILHANAAQAHPQTHQSAGSAKYEPMMLA